MNPDFCSKTNTPAKGREVALNIERDTMFKGSVSQHRTRHCLFQQVTLRMSGGITTG
jgi:hypothetical protein